ncbi:hypothetical protein K439DRAFT_338107 [Ramaria rubella]|nr:hypothetical protein K439DRAFT_338107 [Ramaria rubella]
MMTYGTPIGYVKYHIKASVIRKRFFKGKERAFNSFMFLPPSPPPPLLPIAPEINSEQDLESTKHLWDNDRSTSDIHGAVFSTIGKAALSLWLPRVSSFPRLTPIPFFLCLTIQSRRVKSHDTSHTQPSTDVLPPPAQIDKASMHLRRNLRVIARGGTQSHIVTFDKTPMDNLLHGLTPSEGVWILKQDASGMHWEKGYVWAGTWIFKEAPNFSNRQLTWKYALTAEVPIKGLRNGTSVVSRDLDVLSGVTARTSVVTTLDDMFGLPPDYFDLDGEGNGGEGEDEK